MPRNYVCQNCYITPEEAKAVREVLANTKMTPAGIARRLNLKRATVANYMNGIMNPSPKIRDYIMGELGDVRK